MSLPEALSEIERLRRAGRAAEAEQACRRLVHAHPQDPAVLNALTMLLVARNAFAEAEDAANRAVAAAPGEAVLVNTLGNIHYKLDRLADAEAAYRQAVTLKPAYAVAWYNLGLVLKAMGRLEEALGAQQRAVSLDPRHAGAQAQIGLLLHRLRRPEQAAAALQQAVRLAPDHAEAHCVLGHALAASSREDEALAAYRQAIALKPDYAEAHRAFNDLAWSMGRDVRREPSWHWARQRVGDKPELLLGEAELKLQFGDGAAAEPLLRQAQAASERPEIANALGQALALQGRTEDAEEAYAQAIRLEPGNVRHHQDLATCLLRGRKPAAARTVLETALVRWPHDQMLLGCLTVAYRALGDSRFTQLVDEHLVREFSLPLPAGFANAGAFNASLAGELERLHTQRAAPLDQTLRHGTQTTGSLFERDAKPIALLREAIRETVAQYIRELPQDDTHPFLARRREAFRFAGSWSCRLTSAGFHTNHIHSAWISSAYYVDLPDTVRDGAGGALKFGESQFLLGEDDRPMQEVTPVVGKLVLFPSYYWHGTTPFVSDRARLTVAFDVLPVR